MRTYTVEIDEEIYEFLKNKAEPFVDKKPNDVLRRILLAGTNLSLSPHPSTAVKINGEIPKLPAGTSKAFEQIYQVVRIVRKGSQSRLDATRNIAAKHQVAVQTVIDKYCRQLGLKAAQFDKLLEQPDLRDLKHLLNRKFPDHKELINELTAM